MVMRSSGPTRVSHRPAAGDETYRMRAAGGMLARLTESGWYVERAETVFAEALGDDPYRVEAGLVRDVDLATTTLSASEDILYRTSWGSAFAPEGLVQRRLRRAERLGGGPRAPRLLPAERRWRSRTGRSGGRTGWMRAGRWPSRRDGLADGGVTAQFELPSRSGGWMRSVLVRREITCTPRRDDAPAGPGQARGAPRSSGRGELVREARYDAFDASTGVQASRLELDARRRRRRTCGREREAASPSATSSPAPAPDRWRRRAPRVASAAEWS